MLAIKHLLKWNGDDSPVPSRGDPEDLDECIHHAYTLLRDANRRAIQVPADVITVITTARRADPADMDYELEAKFWNAYGLLSSSIRPAERARRSYRNIFYLVLALLLIFQFFYQAGDYVRSKSADLEKQIIDVRGKSVPANANPASAALTPTAADDQLKRLTAAQQANYRLSRKVLGIADTILDVPLHPLGFESFFTVEKLPTDYTGDVIIEEKLEMLLVFLSGYVLPMLYGLLGACAFVLRKLSDEIDKLTYANDTRVRYSLRLNIGLLSGLAVGWFVRAGPNDAALTSLSPLALAFIAGYGSDLFFVALDRVVHAFAPSPAASTTITTQVTAGGLTQTTSKTEETRVAGLSDAGRVHSEPDAATGPRLPNAPVVPAVEPAKAAA